MTMEDAGQTTWIGLVLVIATNIVTFAIQYIREGRARRWRAEDRKRDQEDRRRRQQEVVTKQVELQDAVSENTQLTRQAVEETGSLARELAAMRQRFETFRRDEVTEPDDATRS